MNDQNIASVEAQQELNQLHGDGALDVPAPLTEEQFMALPEEEKFKLVFESMQIAIQELLGRTEMLRAQVQLAHQEIAQLKAKLNDDGK